MEKGLQNWAWNRPTRWQVDKTALGRANLSLLPYTLLEIAGKGDIENMFFGILMFKQLIFPCKNKFEINSIYENVKQKIPQIWRLFYVRFEISSLWQKIMHENLQRLSVFRCYAQVIINNFFLFFWQVHK